MLNALYAALLADGKLTTANGADGGLSPRSVRYIHTIIHRAFRDAVRWGRIARYFCRPDGGPLHPERFSRTFSRESAHAGLPAIRLHDLRHTWATLALSAGEHPKVVQERLGHANVSITLDVYSHVSERLHSDAASRIASLIFAPVSTSLANKPGPNNE